jgi:AAA15 family ATPase/GTPase
MKTLMLQSFRLKNFKAVRDSRAIRFTPLTVFIGNNGSGKSNIVEGLDFTINYDIKYHMGKEHDV